MTADVSNKVKEENKEMVEKHPYLLPRDFLGNEIEDYNYEFTYLDDMPQGWRVAFGEQMCEEIKEALVKADLLYEYRIEDIKEKFGALRWYGFGATDEVFEIICKYENISARTCIGCGKPATRITTEWILPYCDECISKISTQNSVPIEDFNFF